MSAILIVDDDRSLGASSGSIGLIVTDLTMPIMDGHQLIRLARSLYPEVRIVCMSGCSDRVPPGVAFLRKPFTVSMLSTAIRGCNAA
jgi:FixJ family two-component response regulator